MQKIQKAIDDLNEFANKINDVSIIAMDEVAFEKLLALVYGVINNYYKQRESRERALEVIKLGYQILDTVVHHHISKNFPATTNAVLIFKKTTELLLNVIANDFDVNQSSYNESLVTHKNLRALKACGITPPGHQKPMRPSLPENHLDEEAMKYASENIREFTIFVFNIANANKYIQDPFFAPPKSEALSIYSKVSSLTPSAIPLGHDKQAPSA